MKEKIKLYFQLFITMLKIGLFTFGGGYAMISFLEREYVEKKQWLSHEEFLDIIAISESTPGPIAINSSTFIGYKKAGVLGSFFATLGMILPSFTIIFCISLFFDQFMQITYVQYAFRGIQACVIFLILNAGIKLFKSLKKNVISISLFSLTTIVMVAFSLFAIGFSSIFYILIGGVIGLAVYFTKLIYTKNSKNKSNSIGETLLEKDSAIENQKDSDSIDNDGGEK